MIYVKNFVGAQGESQIKKCENHKSGHVKITGPEMRKPQTNDIDLNQPDLSETDPSIIAITADPGLRQKKQMPMDGVERMDACRKQAKEQIEYDVLLQRHPYETEPASQTSAATCCPRCTTPP